MPLQRPRGAPSPLPPSEGLLPASVASACGHLAERSPLQHVDEPGGLRVFTVASTNDSPVSRGPALQLVGLAGGSPCPAARPGCTLEARHLSGASTPTQAARRSSACCSDIPDSGLHHKTSMPRWKRQLDHT